MTVNRQLAIGYLLLIGAFICLVIIFAGGSLYLIQHGHEPIYQQAFYEKSQAVPSIAIIFHNAASFSALALVQVGLLCLVILQLIRVAMITWFFINLRDKLFSLISFFILSVLIYSFIWR
jgi:uncharacterized membrane protein